KVKSERDRDTGLCRQKQVIPDTERRSGTPGKERRAEVAFDFPRASAQKLIRLLGEERIPAGVLDSGGVWDWDGSAVFRSSPQPRACLNRQAGFTAARPAAKSIYNGRRY